MAEYDFPVELVALPSEGKGYPLENPLSSGTIELKYMTAKEEDILASPNLIKKGVVLDKLFESVVVQKDVNIDDILIGDKNAILLATRVLGYGPEYITEVTDPYTGLAQKVTIDLSKIQTKDIDLSKLNRENRYEFVTPIGKDKIIFKLLTHKDEVAITADIEAMNRLNKNKGGASSDLSTRLRYMIISVNDNTDAGFINKWIMNSFLARDSRAFRTYVSEISPDVDLTFEFTSDLTGETEALSIPFGAGFFYPTE